MANRWLNFAISLPSAVSAAVLPALVGGGYVDSSIATAIGAGLAAVTLTYHATVTLTATPATAAGDTDATELPATTTTGASADDPQLEQEN